MDRKSGEIKVKRVVAAQDMGIVINPDGAKMQMEGCISMGLGYVLTEELNFKGGGGSASDGSLSYGFGADFGINRATSIGVEWASLVRASGYDVNALSLLAKFKF